MKKLTSWHSITLPSGEVTRGHKSVEQLSAEEEALFSLVDVRYKSVLDVGAWDGYFSFAAEKRGARLVFACDWFTWMGEGKKGFDYAKRQMGSRVEEWVCSAEELPVNGPKFDIIFLLGVTYHVKSPIALLERIRHLALEAVIVETEYFEDLSPEPMLRLLPDDRLGGDNSNWNVPSELGAQKMMEIAGYSSVSSMKSPWLPSNRLFLRGDIPVAIA